MKADMGGGGMEGLNKIEGLLNRLGIAASYTGFSYAVFAVDQCLGQKDKLLMVTKRLYPEIAKQYRTNWKAVERNIRTVSDIEWRQHHHLLEELAHRPLKRRPSATEFLSILTLSLRSEPHAILTSGQSGG